MISSTLISPVLYVHVSCFSFLKRSCRSDCNTNTVTPGVNEVFLTLISSSSQEAGGLHSRAEPLCMMSGTITRLVLYAA